MPQLLRDLGPWQGAEADAGTSVTSQGTCGGQDDTAHLAGVCGRSPKGDPKALSPRKTKKGVGYGGRDLSLDCLKADGTPDAPGPSPEGAPGCDRKGPASSWP